MNAIPTLKNDFHVADLKLAAWGPTEITIAQTERPGLMAVRSECAARQPPTGARIEGSLHVTIRTAVLPSPRQATCT